MTSCLSAALMYWNDHKIIRDGDYDTTVFKYLVASNFDMSIFDNDVTDVGGVDGVEDIKNKIIEKSQREIQSMKRF